MANNKPSTVGTSKKTETDPKTTLHSPQSSVSFPVDLADIHSMKQNLQDLLTSFRAGKLKAFGDRNAVEQLENIRQMQGTIGRRHFALDAQVNYKELEDSEQDRDLHGKNMASLLENLEELGTVIKCLNPHATSKTGEPINYGASSSKYS